jgi:hypothetical protein
MVDQPPERRNSPRLVAVTVEWHSDRRGISGRLAGLGTKGRRALALGIALIAAAGAAMVADSPSSGTAPHIPQPKCAYSSIPRVFVHVIPQYAATAVHAPKCP